MKKLNNKGTSLAELIVSLALLAVVLVFMFRILVDVHNEQTNDTFANDNQIVRAEIIKYVEDELNSRKLTRIDSLGNTLNSKIDINFHFDDGKSAKLSGEGGSVTFTNSDGNTRKWTLQNCSLYVNKANVYFRKDANSVVISLNLEIHTNNDLNTVGNNNTLDDIIISYIGPASFFDNIYLDGNINTTCLGYCCNHTCG